MAGEGFLPVSGGSLIANPVGHIQTPLSYFLLKLCLVLQSHHFWKKKILTFLNTRANFNTFIAYLLLIIKKACVVIRVRSVLPSGGESDVIESIKWKKIIDVLITVCHIARDLRVQRPLGTGAV